MKQMVLIFALCVIFSFNVLFAADATGDYRSKATGNWSAFGSWERYNGSAWVAAVSGQTPGVAAGAAVLIRDGHTITIDSTPANALASLTIGEGTTGVLVYQNTTTVRTLTVAGNVELKTSAQFNIGTQTNNVQHVLVIGGNLTVGNTATFGLYSSSTKKGNVTFNSTSASDVTISSPGTPTAVSFGILTLNRGAASRKVVCSVSSTNNGLMVWTNGTWEQSAGTMVFQSNTQVLPVANTGNLSVTGSGSLTITGASLTVSGGTFLVNTSGTVTIGGTGNSLSPNGGTITLTAGTVNVGGRIGSSTAPGMNNWTGTLTINGATVNVPSTSVSNTTNGVFGAPATGGTFTMSSGTLNIQQANQGSYSGNDVSIDGGTISGGTIVLGSASPGTQAFNVKIIPTLNNLTVNTSSNACTLKSDMTIGGALSLTTALTIDAYTLTLNGTIPTITGGLVGGATSNLVIGGTTALTLPAVTSGLNNCTINNAAGVSLTGSFVVLENFTHTAGAITGAVTVDGYFSAAYNYIDIAETEIDISSFSATMSPASLYPYKVDRQWVLDGTFTGSKNVKFYWTSSDDHDYDWSISIPAVYKGSTKISNTSYDVSTATRWIIVPISSTLTKGTYTIGQEAGDLVLPVELSSFTATFSTVELLVTLQWTTESETNNLGFNVLRSTDSNIGNAISMNSDIITGTNTSTQHNYNFNDASVEAPNTYYYWLENVDLDGSNSFNGPVMVTVLEQSDPNTPPVIPAVTKLNSAYPNPFNPDTNISFDLKTPSFVNVTVYDVKGQKIRTLTSQDWNAGTHHLVWNGKNENGQVVGSGVYFYRMTAGKYSATQKVVLMK